MKTSSLIVMMLFSFMTINFAFAGPTQIDCEPREDNCRSPYIEMGNKLYEIHYTLGILNDKVESGPLSSDIQLCMDLISFKSKEHESRDLETSPEPEDLVIHVIQSLKTIREENLNLETMSLSNFRGKSPREQFEIMQFYQQVAETCVKEISVHFIDIETIEGLILED